MTIAWGIDAIEDQSVARRTRATHPLRVLPREKDLRLAPIIRDKEARRLAPLTVVLSVAGAILLATKIYLVSELLVLLAALAVLFSFGTAMVILFVVVYECSKWGVRKLSGAKQASGSSSRGPATVGMPKLALPMQIGASRKG
jgi:hypothetical protein